jgi:hypothetical protein
LERIGLIVTENQQQQQPEVTPEESFRQALQDVIAIVRKLSPHCKNVNELVGMAELALENDGQLALLMNQVTPLRLRT